MAPHSFYADSRAAFSLRRLLSGKLHSSRPASGMRITRSRRTLKRGSVPCRARHYNLFRQRQANGPAVGSQGYWDAAWRWIAENRR